MYITGKTLDDLLKNVFEKLLRSKNQITSTKGLSLEVDGVLLKLSNPRARLSRTETKGTLFSCLGELLWYLARTNDLGFIRYYLPNYKKYSDDGKTIYGAYGPRLFNMREQYNQVDNIINLLKTKPSSRQAVIQLFDASDIVDKHNDIPCTCSLQFIIRKSRLHMFTNMRSNDVFIGLPHDVFAFTMLQEIIARTLGVELGSYKHAVGSLHLYKKDVDKARQYIEEGWQSDIPMPPMPKGDPWQTIPTLLEAESEIRNGKEIELDTLKLDNYWADLVRLLQIFQLSKKDEHENESKISNIEKQISSNVYKPYIQKRQEKVAKKKTPEQLRLTLH